MSVAPHKTFVSFSRPPAVYFNLNWTTESCTYTCTFYTRMSVPDSNEVLLYLDAISSRIRDASCLVVVRVLSGVCGADEF